MEIKEIKDSKQFGRIGVLMGGASSEREISLKSGKAVFEALKQAGFDAISIDIKSDDHNENAILLKYLKLDCAFLALHGRFGEDGQIQHILDKIKLRYTGSGALASKIAMDKVSSHEVFRRASLLAPDYCVLEKKSWQLNLNKCKKLGLPLVIKPAAQGSSIGLSIIDDWDDLNKALEIAFQFDERVIAEEYIKGRELTVGILGESALPVIEIIPKNKFFDFEAKYQVGLTEYKIPAELEPDVAGKVKTAALRAHKLLGCFGCSRVDLMLNSENIPFVLEVNTIPGMTATSLLPKAAKITGLEFNELCFELIKLAYEKK
ncbi:MAG: D-alanine--D-alanine ligase [Candidatus Omnitrophica bacterium]|nr:D-alanine--D-alanine ligase [Candidatus Omnitrophota bacterium]